MRQLLRICLLSLITACSPQDMQSILSGIPTAEVLSNEDVVAGLKQALQVGTERTVAHTGAAGGFWNDARIRIPFPQEAIKVKNTLLDLGMTGPIEDFERTLNDAASKASKEAVPVFVDAITSMTIQDGFQLLRGGDHAATDFLRNKTSDALRARFLPVVEDATKAVALTSYWTPVVNTYNTTTLLTGGATVDPDLNAYVTTKALDGLFLLLSKEEEKIREDPLARTTDLLRKVFAQQ
ncbi:MAG: DUF4197 domain-containing protein [Flavobacteriales bacterium]